MERQELEGVLQWPVVGECGWKCSAKVFQRHDVNSTMWSLLADVQYDAENMGLETNGEEEYRSNQLTNNAGESTE